MADVKISKKKKKKKRNTESINSKFSKSSKGKIMLISKCAACGSKRVKDQDLLRNLGIKTPLNKI